MASFVGSDVSKETFYASLLTERGETKTVFPNAQKERVDACLPSSGRGFSACGFCWWSLGWSPTVKAPPPCFIKMTGFHLMMRVGILTSIFLMPAATASPAQSLSTPKNMVATHAEKVCSGMANGWYWENKLAIGTMNVVLEQTLLLGKTTAFVATYGRLDTDKEDPAARVARYYQGTVYRTDDFSGDFDLQYDATMAPAPSNRSWSLVGVMLKARTAPSWIEIGLSRGDPDAATLSGFTAASTSAGKKSWNPVQAECAPACEIELKGDRTALYAFVNGRKIEEFSRLSLPIVKAYVQLNAQVNAVGDIIST